MNDPYFSSREMEEGSTQAESIHNEFVARVHSAFGRILSRNLSAPPATPDPFDAYLVKATATGAWAGLDGDIVVFLDDWIVMPVKSGMKVFIVEEQLWLEFWDNNAAVSTADSGSQTIVPVFSAGSDRITWNATLGNFAFSQLKAATVLMAPFNMRAGRRYVLRVEQTVGGTHTLSTEIGAFATVGGVVGVDIATPLGDFTDIIIQGPSTPWDKPTIYQTFKDVRVTTS